jgi:hypothetical protein
MIGDSTLRKLLHFVNETLNSGCRHSKCNLGFTVFPSHHVVDVDESFLTGLNHSNRRRLCSLEALWVHQSNEVIAAGRGIKSKP